MGRWVNRHMRRLLLASVIAALLLPVPASAQFGGLLRKRPPAPEQPAKDCSTSPKKNIGRSILGGVLGEAAGRVTRQMGTVGTFIPRAEVAGLLTDAIACKLDPDEQVQAADATVEATRGETVGSTAEWTSATRENVSGTSTVTQKTALDDGSSCMDVTDVVIVDGEETRVSKKMCKAKGQKRYVIMA
jgi:surface antigen